MKKIILLALSFLMIITLTGCSYGEITYDDGENQTVVKLTKENLPAEKPEVPTKDGYLFTGWLYNGEYYDFETPLNKGDVLTAAWIKVHTVTFVLGNGQKDIVTEVYDGFKVDKPADPAMTDALFEGWMLGEKEYDFDEPVTRDLTINAKYIGLHVVTFEYENGQDSTQVLVKDGETITLPANPKKDGYAFVGWTVNGKTFLPDQKITENITIIAKYSDLREELNKIFSVCNLMSFGRIDSSNGTVLDLCFTMYFNGEDFVASTWIPELSDVWANALVTFAKKENNKYTVLLDTELFIFNDAKQLTIESHINEKTPYVIVNGCKFYKRVNLSSYEYVNNLCANSWTREDDPSTHIQFYNSQGTRMVITDSSYQTTEYSFYIEDNHIYGFVALLTSSQIGCPTRIEMCPSVPNVIYVDGVKYIK